MDSDKSKICGSVRIAIAIESFGYAMLVGLSMLACALSDGPIFKMIFFLVFVFFLMFIVLASKRMKKEAEYYGLYIPKNGDSETEG